MFNKTEIGRAPSLLEQARSVVTATYSSKNVSDDHIELVLAWLDDKVTTKQIMVATNDKNIYSKLTKWLKEAHRQGKLTIAE